MGTVRSNKFTFDRQSLTFVGEISDIGGDAIFERAYPDACDAGFRVISDRTGHELMFAVCDEKRNGDGDIMYWMLKPATRQRDPLADALRIRLYND